MSSDERQESEEFSLKIDSAVESFFSQYEESAPPTDFSPQRVESDKASEAENDLETDESPLGDVFAMLSKAENVSETDLLPNEAEPDAVAEKAEAGPKKHAGGSGRRAEKKFDPSATHVFNSLTEAILTVDWEVNATNVNEVKEIIEKIKTDFPTLKESRSQKLIDGMLRTLDVIAESPQRVSTSATAQLEKAIPILRQIASGAPMEDGYYELIEDAIAGLEACRSVDKPSESGTADSPEPMASDGISFDIGDDVTSKVEALEPIAVPVAISHALCHHSKVVEQLTPRARRLSELYAAAQGSENLQALLQKICGLLELQTRALHDAFSLNCEIAVFPTGKINDLSDFLDFQLKAMGVCVRHARVLEKTYKKQPHRKKFRQSIYLQRIEMERQINALTGVARGDKAPVREAESTVPAPL